MCICLPYDAFFYSQEKLSVIYAFTYQEFGYNRTKRKFKYDVFERNMTKETIAVEFSVVTS